MNHFNGHENSVSVVIPAYNHEQYIATAIESVIAQTVQPLEIVIVDDGSKDHTPDVCLKYARAYKFVKYLRQENKGAHNAINTGIEIATGKYIAILNSDDFFFREKIKATIEEFQNNPSSELVCGSKIEFIDGNDQPLEETNITLQWHKRALEFYKESKNLSISLLNENFVATTSNMVFTKNLWGKMGKFQPLRYCHDLQFLVESNRYTKTHIFDGHPLIKYRVHKDNTIKENVEKIRVEIAAVISQAIVENNMALFPEDLKFTSKFLKNKNLSNLCLFLTANYIKEKNQEDFYAGIYKEEIKEKYSVLL